MKRCSRCHEYLVADAFASEKMHRCKACASAVGREWRAANKERARAYEKNRQMVAKYGITYAEFEAMVDKQHGRCACCHDKLGTGRSRAVDHCHDTGRVRGVLCRYCNLALGHARDDQRRLQCLIHYLNERG